MEQIEIYGYNIENIYDPSLTRYANWSPLDLVNGKHIPLIPANYTTAVPPSIPAKKQAKWNGASWNLEDIPPNPNITISNVIKQIEGVKFLKETKLEFAMVNIAYSGDSESTDPKEITFYSVTDTPEHIIAINLLIDLHNFTNAKLERVCEERDSKLNDCAWITQTHIEQKELVSRGLLASEDLTDVKYEDWLKYRQSLRTFAATCNPINPVWPVKPKLLSVKGI